MAAIVLALVGIPLGISTRKGGKSLGVMLSLLLFFVYYILMAFGRSFAMQGRVSPIIGLWLANVLFALAGIIMLSNLSHVRTRMMFLQDAFDDIVKRWQQWRARRSHSQRPAALPAPAKVGGRFLQILDIYVIRGWIFYFGVLLVAFTGVYIIFDFFQVLGDIVRNQVSTRVVVDYYRFLLPQVVYLMLPLSILVATLVNFGLLTKTNQVIAIKSAGVSLYRLSVPVLGVAALLSVGMFLFADRVLPETNQRQNGLRNQIKGKPAQTFYRPDHQWIFGTSSRIYNYTFFDPDQNVFANLSVFEFDPATFRMTRRLHAARAFWEASIHGWILENGWSRDLNGDRVTNYHAVLRGDFQGVDGRTRLLQEGSQTLGTNERARIAPLHRRPQPKRLRRGPAFRTVLPQVLLSPHRLRGYPHRNSLLLYHGRQGRSDRDRLEHRHRHRLLVNLQPL